MAGLDGSAGGREKPTTSPASASAAKASSDTDHAGEVGNIVALCDIDDNSSASKAEKFPEAKKYNDFRKMLDEMGKRSTP